MQESSTRGTHHPSVLQFRQDLETQLRQQVREAIETVLEGELTAALGSARHERTERRQGYRHGALERTITTSDGPRVLQVPRGRVRQADGTTKEFHSQLLPRYGRRTRDVDAAILGSYLAGVNSRRIRTAFKPLLGERHLSKSAVSRIVARLKALFTTWQARDLQDERYAVLYLDGFHLKVRMARRVVAVPVLAALGVAENGQKRLAALQLAATEAQTSWGGLLTDLQRRGLPAPLLVVTDGHAGLKKALQAWSTVRVQRCTTHKERNLDDACPVHARAEMKRDYHRIIHADDGLAARAAYDAFVKKWTTLCPAVTRSIEETGLDLLTFYDFPKAMWKVAAHDEHARESQSRIPASDENAGVIRYRGRGDHVALRARRIRPDRAASHRRSRTLAGVSCEGMVSGRVKVYSDRPPAGRSATFFWR